MYFCYGLKRIINQQILINKKPLEQKLIVQEGRWMTLGLLLPRITMNRKQYQNFRKLLSRMTQKTDYRYWAWRGYCNPTRMKMKMLMTSYFFRSIKTIWNLEHIGKSTYPINIHLFDYSLFYIPDMFFSLIYREINHWKSCFFHIIYNQATVY